MARKSRLSVFEHHQLQIAKKTLGYSDTGAFIMGGMTKPQARAFLRSIGWTSKAIETLEK